MCELVAKLIASYTHRVKNFIARTVGANLNQARLLYLVVVTSVLHPDWCLYVNKLTTNLTILTLCLLHVVTLRRKDRSLRYCLHCVLRMHSTEVLSR